MRDNIYRYTDTSAVQEQAAAWLIKLDADQPPSREDLDGLREWMGRSPAHRQALSEMAKFWDNQVLTELSVPLEKRRNVSRQPGLKMLSGLAAALVVTTLCVLLVYSTPRFSTDSANGLYATAVGQQKTIDLIDGSRIQLNTDTQIRVDFSDEARDIRLLRGEAHFTVAKDIGRPFRVYAGNSRVEAVGTAFSVYEKDDKTEVLVTEGTVALSTVEQQHHDSAPAAESFAMKIPYRDEYTRELGRLTVGQKTIVRETKTGEAYLAEVEHITSEDIGKALSWRQGILTFKGEPLDEVVAEIRRYTPVLIEISDPSVGDIRIGGQIQVEDTEAILDALEVNFGLEVTRLGYNHIQLSAVDAALTEQSTK